MKATIRLKAIYSFPEDKHSSDTVLNFTTVEHANRDLNRGYAERWRATQSMVSFELSAKHEM